MVRMRNMHALIHRQREASWNMKTAAQSEAYYSVPRLLTSARRKATLPERSAKQEFGQTGATFQWPGGRVVANPKRSELQRG